MSMINIDELNNNIKKKEKQKNIIYDSILKKCHHKIKKTSEVSSDGYCFYVIPQYMYGFPLYDFKSCIMYLFKSLTDNGFDVKYTHPNLLFISWIGKTNPKNYKAIEQKNKGYRSVTEFKSNENIIHNRSLNFLNDKLNSLTN